MAIKRNDVRAILENEELSIEERVKSVMDLLHSETDVLRDKCDELQAQYDQANSELETARTTITEKETAINDANAAFEAYKTEQAEKEMASNKRNHFKSILKKGNVSDKNIDRIIRLADLSEINLNKDGSVRDPEKTEETIRTNWADYFPDTNVVTPTVETPPANNAKEKVMTKEEIMAVKDRVERRRLIQENPDAFK